MWSFNSYSAIRNPKRPQFLQVTMTFTSVDETALSFQAVDPQTGVIVMNIANGIATYVEQNVVDVSIVSKLAADWLRQYNSVQQQLTSLPTPQSVQTGMVKQLNPSAPVLKAEIQTDPVAMGYGAWVSTADDARIHGLLTDATKRPFAVPQVLVTAQRLVNCFDAIEYAALTVLQISQLSGVLSAGQVDLQSTTVRTILSNIFPAAGTTRAAILALWTSVKPATTQSRAQELGVIGVQLSDVTFARTN